MVKLYSDDSGNETKRLIKRLTALKNERSSWDTSFMQLRDYIMPRAGKFWADMNSQSAAARGQRKDNKIIDNTATRAARVLGAGLLAGMASPSEPWMELQAADLEVRKLQTVKQWCADATDELLSLFAGSNVYRTLHSMFEELGVFGTSAAVITEDEESGVWTQFMTIGSFALATDAKGRVTTLVREVQMTVEQVVTEFGYENCTRRIKDLYDRDSLDVYIKVVHSIAPRPANARKGGGKLAAKFRECYFEWGCADSLLWESGYDYFNVIAPRWIVNGEDVYGASPGFDTIGDIIDLQHKQIRKAQAIDLQTKPPLVVPNGMQYKYSDFLAGGVSSADMTNANGGVKTAFQVNLDLSHLVQDIQDTRQRISRMFYEDLFMMISSDDRSGVTAREIAERHNEKMLMLGPVIERIQNEALAVLVQVGFTILMEAGRLPPPPNEIEGKLEIKFTSIMAQAQRLAKATLMDRQFGTIASMAQVRPDVLDKLDVDAWVDEYARIFGTNPKLIVPTEDAQAVRQQRQQAQAQAMQAQQTIEAGKAGLVQGPGAQVPNAIATSQGLG